MELASFSEHYCSSDFQGCGKHVHCAYTVAGASPTGVRGGQDHRTFENRGVRPPRNLDISVSFLLKRIFCIFQHFHNRVAEIREET